MPKSSTHKRDNYRLPVGLSDQFLADLGSYLDIGHAGFKHQYLRQHMLSKYVVPDPRGSSDRRKAAIAKWLSTEMRNERTNTRLYANQKISWFHNGKTTHDLIDRARRLIVRVIGHRVPFHFLGGGFSGGASTSKRRQPAMVGRKFNGVQHVSSSAWPYMIPNILGSVWRYNEDVLTPEFVDYNVLFTVPKTSTIDRVACKEPDYNMYLQKGVGDFIRNRLRKRIGIDLNDQTANQRWAKLGSITGSLATIDLSSASDSMTTALVHLLLPSEWFTYLDDIRVKYTRIDNVKHALRMFSSMGNGFTFELETLLFWALCRATLEVSSSRSSTAVVCVYGDDIVIPTKSYPMVKRTLNYFGFMVNDEKSFYHGNLRESCGKHYLRGVDITPFYLRGPLVYTDDLINALNSLRRWARFSEDSTWCDWSVYHIWRRYAKYVDQKFWGGHDLSDKSRLVSYWRPGKPYRLTYDRAMVKGDQSGDYVSWLHDSEKRSRLTSSQTIHMVERKVRVARRVQPEFGTISVPIWDEELIARP